MDNFAVKDKWSLITGASSGIGAAFARALAEKGSHLVLVARREPLLQELARELEAKHNIQVKVIAMDLSELQAPSLLYQNVKQQGIHISVLVNNAGMGTFGKLHEVETNKSQNLLLLNINTLSQLTQFFIKDFLAAKEGWIFNIASTGAFQALPYMANYGASKAFVLSFSEALSAEYHSSGIKVLAVCPGVTSTEFFGAMNTTVPYLATDTAENVAKTAIKAISKGKILVICGHWSNAALVFMGRFLPRKLVVTMSEMVIRKSFSAHKTPAPPQ